MKNFNKIYPAKIYPRVEWVNRVNPAKILFSYFSRFAKPVSVFGFMGAFVLILQVFAVGVFDRSGVSPKVSALVSSLVYAAVFAGLAIVGGLKRKEIAETVEVNLNARPICKMLIIKRKNQELSGQAKVKTKN